MQVAVYVRVSSRSQARAQTIEQQIDRLRTHAAAQSWTLAPEQIFRDDGYSGANLRRPGLDRLRDAAAGARLDRLLITAPDRLARNYVHQMLLVEELQGHGVVVEFLDRPMSQDPHDQLLLQIRGGGRVRADADYRADASRPPAQAAGRCPAALDTAALRVPG